MLKFFLAFMAVCLAAAGVNAKENCYSCHGQKGMPGHIERTAFEQSVHGLLPCAECHIDIRAYPHGKALQVNCGICHLLGREGAPKEQARQYKLSVHGQAVAAGNPAAPKCQTCHGSHYVYPSSDLRSRTFRGKIPVLCSSCHPREFDAYRKSIHGKELLEKNNTGAAACFDCHLEHLVPRTNVDQWKLSLIRQCGSCHAAQMMTYRKTYHGKITRLGYATVAKCADCHGSHDILPPSDPASRLSTGNIVATCRKCHPSASIGFTKFYAHAEESNRSRYPALYYVYLFMTLLLIGVFTFFFIHTLLWSFRSLKERMARKGGG